MAVSDKIADAWSEGGLREILCRAKRKVWQRREVVVLCCTLDKPRVEHQPGVETRFEWINETRIHELNLAELDFSRDALNTAKKRLRAGDKCLVGYVHDEPATYLWLTTTARHISSACFQLGKGKAFIYKTFTRREHRGRGLNRAALSSALEHLRRQSFDCAFIDVNRANSPSLRAISAAGFQEVGSLRVYRVGKTEWVRVPKRLARMITQKKPASQHTDL